MDRDRPPLFEPGDRVAVLGLGASGRAAARLAHRLGAAVYASDAVDGTSQVEAVEHLRSEGIEAESGAHDIARILASRLVITSPGIDPATEVRSAVREAGVRTIAEIELAFRSLRSKVIGITGTNGKTTTTALCGHLLQTGGIDAVTAGNIGRPLSDVAIEESQPDWVVVELSSFQLGDLDAFASAIGILLNLAPDHLDRYPDVERYYADKARIFANATEESRWVLNADDPTVLQLAHGVPGRRCLVSLAPVRGDGAFVDEEGWMVQRTEGRTERWLPAADLPLLGRHNLENALLAGAGAALAGCGAEAIGEGLASFEALPHRLRPVCEHDGVLWINDSKATNVSATRVALEAFERPVVLLLGGRHKGEPYTSLLPGLVGARGVVAFGEAAPIIVRELSGAVPLEVANGLDEAIRVAAGLARPGDAVLLSPACSSYDMFPNYAVRGDTFEAAVRGLHEQEVT